VAGCAAGPVEAGAVGLQGAIGAECGERGLEQSGGFGRGGHLEAIVHPLAFAACADEACAAQVGEVARDLGLALAQHIDEIADADLAVIDEIEQTETRGVA